MFSLQFTAPKFGFSLDLGKFLALKNENLFAFSLLNRNFALYLQTVTANHDAFGRQSSMKCVAIISQAVSSLFVDGVTLRSGRDTGTKSFTPKGLDT